MSPVKGNYYTKGNLLLWQSDVSGRNPRVDVVNEIKKFGKQTYNFYRPINA
jgi:hypothetical protein